MLRQLTYRQKCYALLGGFLVFLLLGWKLSFSSTFALRHEIAAREKKVQWLKEKEKEIPFLKAKMDLVEQACGNDSAAVRDRLTAYISDFAEKHGCVVTEIPSFSTYKNVHLRVQTNVFTVRGTFVPLLTLVQQLENRFRSSAKIMSLQFNTLRDPQSKRKNLYLTLITQSFDQSKNRHE